ncbi:MAG TPA: glycine cleavage T C-terminal barrel domain-containing protein, partial [Conexibacter sp.]|nr:glycine cleavage T C-terminal barrel domain-containing protein [Conexibacter sp.]
SRAARRAPRSVRASRSARPRGRLRRSFTKGCYVGQETVARLFYKGKPNRNLRGLRLAAPVQPGSELTLEGKRVGTVGSVAQSPLHGPIALALVRREAAPGSTVSVGETTAEVVELPF